MEIRAMGPKDAARLAKASAAVGWEKHKPRARFERYYAESKTEQRLVLLAQLEQEIMGYTTICWTSGYSHFRARKIPEICDLNVFPHFRRQGVGAMLMMAAEDIIFLRSEIVGVGVGMYPDYGPAQRLYAKRGYLPDGRGLAYAGRTLAPLDVVINDDSLTLYLTKHHR